MEERKRNKNIKSMLTSMWIGRVVVVVLFLYFQNYIVILR